MSRMHLANVHAVALAGPDAEKKVEKLIGSMLLIAFQISAIAAVHWAVALPSCTANRHCPGSMYC